MPFLCAYTSGIQSEVCERFSRILLNSALYKGKMEREATLLGGHLGVLLAVCKEEKEKGGGVRGGVERAPS
jgi:hypothetical protein